MAIIIDGKALAAKCKEEVRTAVAAMERKPGLAVILVGENPASQVYVRNKQKDCQECGIHSEEFVLPADYGQPRSADAHRGVEPAGRTSTASCASCPCRRATATMRRRSCWPSTPSKDVDAFHPYNVGRIMIGDPQFPALHSGGGHGDAGRVPH